jgi:hypothetical protein
MVRHFTILAAVGATACSTTPQAASTPKACPIVSSSDWAAWVNAMPGEGGARLIVTGKATVPTGGYTFEWGNPIVAESFPVQVTVELRPVAPSGMATQALVTHQVRGQWPSHKRVGSVRILCAGQQLALISSVETAQ